LVCGTGLQYQFWEVGTWSVGLHIEQERGAMFMPMMAFSPDGKILAGTFGFYKVRLFNAATGAILADIEAPDPWQVTCLSFSPDGSQLAACGGNSALHLWDLRRIREQLSRMHLDWNLPPYAPKLSSLTANR
jgi:WD40 repeat protein